MCESVASGPIPSVALNGQALQHVLFKEYLHALDLQVISLKAEFVDDRAWPQFALHTFDLGSEHPHYVFVAVLCWPPQ